MSDQILNAAVESLIGGTLNTFVVCAGAGTLVTTKTAAEVKTLLAITSSDITGLGTGVATWLATPSSANLRGALTDETGTGAAVFADNPTILRLTLAGAISTTAWTTNGVCIAHTARTITDTSSSGTVAAAYTNVLGGNTIAASAATTFTRYATMYLGNPTAGTNVTITNPLSLMTEGRIECNGYTSYPTSVTSGWPSTGSNVGNRFGLVTMTQDSAILNLSAAGELAIGGVSFGRIVINSTWLNVQTSGTWQLGTSSSNALGSLACAAITASALVRLGIYTVATLPSAAANSYAEANVSDALAPAMGVTVAAGGSVKTKVRSNGTNWTVCGI